MTLSFQCISDSVPLPTSQTSTQPRKNTAPGETLRTEFGFEDHYIWPDRARSYRFAFWTRGFWSLVDSSGMIRCFGRLPWPSSNADIWNGRTREAQNDRCWGHSPPIQSFSAENPDSSASKKHALGLSSSHPNFGWSDLPGCCTTQDWIGCAHPENSILQPDSAPSCINSPSSSPPYPLVRASVFYPPIPK